MKTLFLLVTAAIVLPAAETPSFAVRKAQVRQQLREGELAAALEAAKAINHDWADDIEGYQLMAQAHLALGDYAEAEAALQWMLDLRIGKADSEGWRLVAMFREVTGDTEGAIEAASEAYRRVPPRQPRVARELVLYLAHLYTVVGKPGAADNLLMRQATGALDAPDALEVLAEIRAAQGRHEEAIAACRELLRSDAHPRHLYRQAQLTRDPEDYRRFVTEARARTDRPDNANRELVLYLAGTGGSPNEAIGIARRESSRRHDIYTADALAVALLATGHREEARGVMTRIVGVGTRDPEILKHATAMGITVEP